MRFEGREMNQKMMGAYKLGDLVLLPNRFLYIKSINALVLADVHIGVEYSFAEEGIYIPPLQFNKILKNLRRTIDEYKPKRIIIVGDLKHTFHEKTPQEHKEVIKLLSLLEDSSLEAFLVRGNHDNFIRGVLERHNVEVVEKYLEMGDYLFTHGHRTLEDDFSKKTIIFAHIHPTVMLTDGINRDRFPVFLIDKNKVVLPATTPLLPGFDIIGKTFSSEEYFSPLIQNIEKFDVYLVIDEKKVLKLGKMGKLVDSIRSP